MKSAIDTGYIYAGMHFHTAEDAFDYQRRICVEKIIPIYSDVGRILHTYPLAPALHTTDDFGNAVKVSYSQLSASMWGSSSALPFRYQVSACYIGH